MPETSILDSDNRIDLVMPGSDGHERVLSEIEQLNSEDSNRQDHLNKQERWYKKRYGVRPRVVTWPWRNASNLHLPLVDKMIRRGKPKYIRLIDSVDPIVTFKPNLAGDDLAVARSLERQFDEKLRFKLGIVEKISLGVDKMLEKGYFIAKVVQEFQEEELEDKFILQRQTQARQDFLLSPDVSEEEKLLELADVLSFDVEDDDDLDQLRNVLEGILAGREEIKFKKTVVHSDFPSLFIRDPRKIVVPSDTTDIRMARSIRDRVGLMMHTIEANAVSGVWHKKNSMELLSRIRKDERQRDTKFHHTQQMSDEGIEQLEDRREGLATGRSGLEEFDETYIWFKWPGSRLPQRSVLTTHKDHPDIPLRFIKYPYFTPDGKQDFWPFVQGRFEINSERFYSPRGLPQMLDSLQTEITNNHNAKQNQMTIANNLNIKVKRSANISTSWIPGQPLVVNRMDDVEELPLQPKDTSYDREEQILKSWAEEYAGLVDASLSGPNSLTEPRTKFEVQQVAQIQSDVAFGDVTTFQISMQKIYEMIFNRWMQYGPDEIPLADGNTISKLELKRRFTLIPTGNLSNSSTEIRKQEAFVRFQAFRGDPRINQDELYRDTLIKDDERLAERLLVPSAQVQMEQVRKQIEEIQRIGLGYTEVPELSDDDDIHIQIIEDFINDPKKNRNFPQDRVEALLFHRQAHIVAKEKKSKATSRGDRIQQEVAQVAQGNIGREQREVPQ